VHIALPLLDTARGRHGDQKPSESVAPADSGRTRAGASVPRGILLRGGVATYDDARAVRDVRAAQDRSEW